MLFKDESMHGYGFVIRSVLWSVLFVICGI